MVRVGCCEQWQRVFRSIMQTFLQVLYNGMSAKQPLADHGNISKQMVCRDVLALIDHVSLLNESQLVREMPMSLLECTTWTFPNVWVRTAYCSATFSTTLSCLTSVVPTQTKARPLQTCQAARWPIHASATFTCSTLLPANGALIRSVFSEA